jgi:hypothetical protein
MYFFKLSTFVVCASSSAIQTRPTCTCRPRNTKSLNIFRRTNASISYANRAEQAAAQLSEHTATCRRMQGSASSTCGKGYVALQDFNVRSPRICISPPKTSLTETQICLYCKHSTQTSKRLFDDGATLCHTSSLTRTPGPLRTRTDTCRRVFESASDIRTRLNIKNNIVLCVFFYASITTSGACCCLSLPSLAAVSLQTRALCANERFL